jgi:hypothetical protein
MTNPAEVETKLGENETNDALIINTCISGRKSMDPKVHDW